MKIKILSDLHLESDSTNYLPPKTDDDATITLILAGDICEINKTKKLISFLEKMCEQYLNVIYILGNHEFYGGHIVHSIEKIKHETKHLTNLFILENESILLNGVKFIGATLWTDMNGANPIDKWHIQQRMNDYRYIRIKDYQKIKPDDTILKHRESVKFITRELSNVDDPAVVVTHHAPSLLSIHEQYRGNVLNAGYVSDLSELILDYKPTFWIHGHMHNSFDYMIGDSRILCNPKGYTFTPGYVENPSFDDKNIFAIG